MSEAPQTTKATPARDMTYAGVIYPAGIEAEFDAAAYADLERAGAFEPDDPEARADPATAIRPIGADLKEADPVDDNQPYIGAEAEADAPAAEEPAPAPASKPSSKPSGGASSEPVA